MKVRIVPELIAAKVNLPENVTAEVCQPENLSARIDTITLIAGLSSEPPEGKKRITNLYWDQNSDELVFLIEE